MSAFDLDPTKTLPRVITDWATKDPDRVYVRHVDGDDLTYAMVDDLGRRWASVLRDERLEAGQHVATMLRPSGISLCAWLGIAHVGGVDVGVNVDFRGRMLSYVLNLSESEILITNSEFLPMIEAVRTDLIHLRSVIVVDDRTGATTLPVSSAEQLVSAAEPFDGPGPEQWDVACLTFTSGTTGPSKAVCVPWGQLFVFSTFLFRIEELDEHDVYLSPWPVYHTTGRFGPYMMALLGGQIVYKDHFSLTSWLDELRRFGVTTMLLWPPMMDHLRNLPEGSPDADIPLRNVSAVYPPDHAELTRRFGFRIRCGFGSTEVPLVISPEHWTLAAPGSIGTLQAGWPGFEARLVDLHDQEVPRGQPGELIVRCSTPWTMNLGYFRNPEATARAWRNGWFHTGDMLRQDADGNFYFLDRATDSIRRRGENISSYEVEAYVVEHPGVSECAAVAAPVPERYDQEVKVVVVRDPRADLTHAALIEYLVERMPRFMIPRFVEFADELPRTESTMKVRKVELRETAFNERTWDRELDGFLDIPSSTFNPCEAQTV